MSVLEIFVQVRKFSIGKYLIFMQRVLITILGRQSPLRFSKLQNKMHFAAHGHTAAEIVYLRADADKDFMGMTSFDGKSLRKIDASIAKNYLKEDEIKILNRLVTAYLEFAELQAIRQRPMYMRDWIEKLERWGIKNVYTCVNQ